MRLPNIPRLRAIPPHPITAMRVSEFSMSVLHFSLNLSYSKVDMSPVNVYHHCIYALQRGQNTARTGIISRVWIRTDSRCQTILHFTRYAKTSTCHVRALMSR